MPIAITAGVTVRLPGLRRFQRQLPERVQRVYVQWNLRYRTYIQRRFNRFSRGGGDWPPLKYRQGSILRDTNTLYTALTPSMTAPSGSISQPGRDGLVIGYGGNASHPGGPTIAQIAKWHHDGAGNLPVRKIIVLPDDRTLRQMVQDMDRELDR